MEKHLYAVGDRVEKLCGVCREERGHVVASVTKHGRVSRVDCPKCGTRSTLRKDARLAAASLSAKAVAPYDWTHAYHAGQTLMHPTFGLGEVTALIGSQKIDVLFPDRMRRIIHART